MIAIEASIQLKCMTGFEIVGARSSNGSTINVKPVLTLKEEKHAYILAWNLIYEVSIFTGTIQNTKEEKLILLLFFFGKNNRNLLS